MSDADARASVPTGPRPPRHVIIHPDSDIVLRVYHEDKPKTFIGDDGVTPKRGEILVTFQVSKQILIDNSEYFKTMFSTVWDRSGQSTFDLGQNHVVALHIWLRVFHGTTTIHDPEIGVDKIWHAIQISRQYFLKIETLNGWFDGWLKRMGGDLLTLKSIDMSDLPAYLYPCYELENAQGFATITRRLVYEMNGPVEDFNPSRYGGLRMPFKIMQALNAARGNLKTQIYTKLYKTQKFLDSECLCRGNGLIAYEEALHETGAWPMHEQLQSHGGQKSIHRVLTCLKTFNYHAPNDTCEVCSHDYGEDVKKAIKAIEANFGGLCLDCLDEDQERDVHDTIHDSDGVLRKDKSYDHNCRVDHGQPSWYYSLMGRNHVPTAYEKEHLERKRKATGSGAGTGAARG